mmetsp:Transcript_14714/g.34402  ORF Transcript_14714/g.34402 Transcript_14714/m.34402 type:complete len:243 (+) Transcript_14714:163-891(+)
MGKASSAASRAASEASSALSLTMTGVYVSPPVAAMAAARAQSVSSAPSSMVPSGAGVAEGGEDELSRTAGALVALEGRWGRRANTPAGVIWPGSSGADSSGDGKTAVCDRLVGIREVSDEGPGETGRVVGVRIRSDDSPAFPPETGVSCSAEDPTTVNAPPFRVGVLGTTTISGWQVGDGGRSLYSKWRLRSVRRAAGQSSSLACWIRRSRKPGVTSTFALASSSTCVIGSLMSSISAEQAS